MSLALEGTPVIVNALGVTTLSVGPFTTTLASEVFITNVCNTAGITSISGGGLTWARRVDATSSAGVNHLEHWAAQASGALSGVTFTITYSGGGSAFTTAALYAFSGQDTSTIWDGNASVPAHTDNGPDPQSITTSNANDVVIAGFRAGTASPTAGTGFTQICGSNFLCVEYKILSATGTTSCTLGTGAGGASACVADALMQATAGGASTPWAYRFSRVLGVGPHVS